MATGGRDQSITGGHEIFYEWRCNKCEENDRIAEGIAYCRNCNECFCDACLRDHNRFVRDHTVLREADKDDWGKPIASQDSGMECSEHKGQSIAMYCGRHDEVCCPVCAYLHHGETCKPNMSFIPKVAQGIESSVDFKKFIGTNDELLIRLVQTEKERTDCLSATNASRGTCIKDIESIGQSLIRRIEELQQISITDMNNIIDDELDTIQADIAQCVELRHQLNSIKQQMQTNVNESSLFVKMKTKGKVQLNCDKVCKALSKKAKKTYLINQEPLLQQLFMANSLGECIESDGDPPPVPPEKPKKPVGHHPSYPSLDQAQFALPGFYHNIPTSMPGQPGPGAPPPEPQEKPKKPAGHHPSYPSLDEAQPFAQSGFYHNIPTSMPGQPGPGAPPQHSQGAVGGQGSPSGFQQPFFYPHMGPRHGQQGPQGPGQQPPYMPQYHMMYNQQENRFVPLPPQFWPQHMSPGSPNFPNPGQGSNATGNQAPGFATGHGNQDRGSPPPYNSGDMGSDNTPSYNSGTNVNQPNPVMSGLGPSRAVKDQEDYMEKLQHKIDQEKQAEDTEEEEVTEEELPTKILVSDIPPSKADEDYLTIFFENKNKYGGGPVTNVELNEEEGVAIVEFEDPEAVQIVLEKQSKQPIMLANSEIRVEAYVQEKVRDITEVIDNVLHREHKLGPNKHDVKLFVDCLGRPQGDEGESRFKIPDTVFVPDPNTQKIKFILNSKTCKDAIENQMSSCHTKVHWPETDAKPPLQIKLECTLTPKTKNCYKLAEEWKNNSLDNFQDYMKTIVLMQISVRRRDLWSDVVKTLQEITIGNPEAVAVFVEMEQGNVTIVGVKRPAEHLFGDIKQRIKKMNEAADLAKPRVKETMDNLHLIDTKMLLAIKYPTQMEEKYKDLKVKINQNKNEIVFDGLGKVIPAAKLDVYEMIDEFAKRKFKDIPPQSLVMYQIKQVKEYIVKTLKQKNVPAVWDVEDDGLVVCSSSQETLGRSIEFIRDAVKENSLPLSRASRSIVNTDEWDNMVASLRALHQGKVLITIADMSQVVISSTDDVELEALKTVKRVLKIR